MSIENEFSRLLSTYSVHYNSPAYNISHGGCSYPTAPIPRTLGSLALSTGDISIKHEMKNESKCLNMFILVAYPVWQVNF